MAQYINKSAVVAKIERQILAIDKMPKITDTQISVLSGNKVILTKLLSFIDTLEVKEVDFEKIWKEYFKYRGDVATVNVKHLAKYFFELGLKAQTGK